MNQNKGPVFSSQLGQRNTWITPCSSTIWGLAQRLSRVLTIVMAWEENSRNAVTEYKMQTHERVPRRCDRHYKTIGTNKIKQNKTKQKAPRRTGKSVCNLKGAFNTCISRGILPFQSYWSLSCGHGLGFGDALM